MQEFSNLKSVQNGLRVLKLFSDEKPILGVTEIATTLHLNKSTVSRLVKDLVEEGFLEKVKTKYRLGHSLLTLSGIIMTHLEIPREAKQSLKALVDSCAETAHISILEGATITYLDIIECKQPVRLLSKIGKRNPASCTSSGKVLLAYQPLKKTKAVVSEGLPKTGPNSVTDEALFLKELIKIKEQGFAVCIEELHEGVISIGAPIKDFTGEVVSAVSVAGPKQRMEKYNLDHYISEIVKAGEEISFNLGYR